MCAQQVAEQQNQTKTHIKHIHHVCVHMYMHIWLQAHDNSILS